MKTITTDLSPLMRKHENYLLDLRLEGLLQQVRDQYTNPAYLPQVEKVGKVGCFFNY
ncbi:MAG: hypothetical protein PUP92_04565 [Rhizonema sp. PD38]|nr:hypothetical protein [Rhizonema sp. PD38]